MNPFEDVLTANAALHQATPPPAGTAARGLAVLTCMDARVAPLSLLGLQVGDAVVLRNAGAQVTAEVLTTLVLATRLLGVSRIMVIAHTDCKMTKATDADLHEQFLAGGVDTRSLDFATIGDQDAALARGVQRIRSSPYLPAGVAVIGCRYDVRTGRLAVQVPADQD